MPMLPEISVLIRFHDPDAASYLRRSLLSLMTQCGVRARPIVLLQDFEDAAETAVRQLCVETWWLYPESPPDVVNVRRGDKYAPTADLRSALLNTGIRFAREQLKTQYLAILDYDDILYGNAYQELIQQLRQSGAAIAFGRIKVCQVVALHEYDFVYSIRDLFKGRNKLDLLRDNFCPIHSYVFDLSAIAAADLKFNETLARLEDYELILRIVAKYRSDFSLIDKVIGLYVWRSDGTNTAITGVEDCEELAAKSKAWKDALLAINDLKRQLPVNFWASDF